MKNDLYKSMCAAFAVLFVSMAQQGMAQDTYNIKIAGVSVTSENCNNLSVIKGVTESKYDNDSKTLTLDGATIHATSTHGIENRVDGLIIRVSNESSIVSDKQTSIWNMDKEIVFRAMVNSHLQDRLLQAMINIIKLYLTKGQLQLAIVVSKQVVGVMAFMVVIGYLITVMYA